MYSTPQRRDSLRRNNSQLRSSLHRHRLNSSHFCQTPPLDENTAYDSTDTMSVGSSASSAKFQLMYRQQHLDRLPPSSSSMSVPSNSPFLDRSNQPGSWGLSMSERQRLGRSRWQNTPVRMARCDFDSTTKQTSDAAFVHISGDLAEMRKVRNAALSAKQEVLGKYAQNTTIDSEKPVRDAPRMQPLTSSTRKPELPENKIDSIVGAAKRFVESSKSNTRQIHEIDSLPFRSKLHSDYSTEEKDDSMGSSRDDASSICSDCSSESNYTASRKSRRHPPDHWIEREKREFDEQLRGLMITSSPSSSQDSSFKSKNGRLSFEDLVERSHSPHHNNNEKRQTTKLPSHHSSWNEDDNEQGDEEDEYRKWIQAEQEKLQLRLTKHNLNMDYREQKEREEQLKELARLEGRDNELKQSQKRSAWSLESAIASRNEVQKVVVGASPSVSAALPSVAQKDDQELMVQLAKRLQAEMREQNREIQQLRGINERVIQQQRTTARKSRRRQSLARLPNPKTLLVAISSKLRRKSMMFMR